MKKNFQGILISPYAIFFACAAAIFLGALHIKMFSVNALFWDEYELVDMVVNNEISLEALFRQHNEHRIFFPKLLYNTIAQSTGMNTVPVMYFSFFLVTAAYLMLMFYLFKINKTPLNVLYPVIFGLIIFNPAQSENLLWGFQISFIMAHVFSIFSIFFAQLQMQAIGKTSSRIMYFILSVTTAIVASFSSSQGLMSWISITLVWLLAFRKQVLKSHFFYIWIFCLFLVFISYFNGYVKPNHHPSLTYFVAYPVKTATYLFHLLGCGLLQNTLLSVISGVVIFTAALIMLFDFLRSKELKDVFSIGLIIYGGLVCSIICIGRAGFYVQAIYFTSRYATFSLVILIGILIYIINFKQSANTKYIRDVSVYRVFNVTFAVFIIFLLISAYRTVSYIAQSDVQQENKFIIQTYDQQPNIKITRLYPAAEVARNRLDSLRKWRYSVFLEKNNIDMGIFINDSNMLSGDWISFDTKDVIKFVGDTGDPYIRIAGWAFNPATRAPLEAVYLSLNGVLYPVFYGKSRPDRRFSFRKRALYFTGFERTIPLSVLKDGQYSIEVFGLCKDRPFHYYKIEPDITFRVNAGLVEIQASSARLP